MALVAAVLLSVFSLDEINGLRCSVARVGDVDGDGAADFCLARRGLGPTAFGDAAPREDELGRVWVVSGRDGRLLRSLEAPGDPLFGRALADLGDLDGDGKRELAIGGKRTWVFSGAGGAVLQELEGGFPVGGGDFDGDGTPDLALKLAGQSIALVYSGETWNLLRAFGTAGAAPRKEWREGHLYQQLPGRRLRDPLAFVPDRDGDGRDELCIVCERSSEDWDAALVVVSSKSGERLLEASIPKGGSENTPWVTRVLGDLDGDGVEEFLLSMVNDSVVVFSGATGAVVRKHDYAGGYLNGEGTSLDVVGDYNADGIADYLVAANEDGMDCDPGLAVVFSGASGTSLRLLEFQYGEGGSCGPGVDACAIGDVDGDGLSEVAVHIPRLRQARVLSGASFDPLLTIDLAVAPYRIP